MFSRRNKKILEQLDRIEAKQDAAHAAMKKQLGEVHGRMSTTLDKAEAAIELYQETFEGQIKDLHERISFNNRPKP